MRGTFERIGEHVLRVLAPQEKAQACSWAPGRIIGTYGSVTEYKSTTSCGGTHCYVIYAGSSVQLGATCP
ncbi:hypothetical protein [Streptacidiphilus sp. PAMC 29251]